VTPAVTSFVGRRRVLAQARRLVTRGPVLTLTGVGGVGKTRLATQLANSVAERAFPDGVWLVDLAALTDSEPLLRTMATVLGVPDQPTGVREALLAHMADKRLLLVLDNCEHLLAECTDLVNDLVHAASGVRILATSREALRVPGEHVLTVPPLGVPDTDELILTEATQYPALTLFVDRAKSVQPEFRLTADNIATVARLCRRLDGLPLAIELAAARLTLLSIEEILVHLADRFRLLTGGWRTAQPRHRTMLAAIDWSYQLCSPAERTLWARMSVFVGTADMEAVEAVCADHDSNDNGGAGSVVSLARGHIMDLVAELVGKSIVTPVSDGGRTRYRLLETIHEYGRQCLAASGEETALRRRHRSYYQTLATRQAAEWFGPDEADWLARLQADWPNLRAAWRWCVAHPDDAGNAAAALEMPTDLVRGRAPFFGGHLPETTEWLHRGLELNPDPSSARARALAMVAWISSYQGHSVTGPLDDARAVAEQFPNDSSVQASLAYAKGLDLLIQGNYHALALLTDAHKLHDAAEQPGDAHMCLLWMATAASFLGSAQQADDICARCLNHAQTHRAEWALAWAQWTWAVGRWRHGDHRRSRELLVAALRRWRAQGDTFGRMWALEAMGWLATTAGEHIRAALLLGAAATRRQHLGVSFPVLTPVHALHMRCEDILRREFGDEAFDREFDRGADLSAEEAMRLALNESTDTTTPATTRTELADELTKREWDVVELIEQGLTSRRIGDQLFISARTVDEHIAHIRAKLGLANRAQIAAWASQQRRPDRD